MRFSLARRGRERVVDGHRSRESLRPGGLLADDAEVLGIFLHNDKGHDYARSRDRDGFRLDRLGAHQGFIVGSSYRTVVMVIGGFPLHGELAQGLFHQE